MLAGGQCAGWRAVMLVICSIRSCCPLIQRFSLHFSFLCVLAHVCMHVYMWTFTNISCMLALSAHGMYSFKTFVYLLGICLFTWHLCHISCTVLLI